MKCQKKWWCVSSSSSWRVLCSEPLANIIHLAGYHRMFLTLTSHRTWIVTRNHDLEALTNDTERGGEDSESKPHIDILPSALGTNNQNMGLFFVRLKHNRVRQSERATCMCVLIARLVPVIPWFISIRQRSLWLRIQNTNSRTQHLENRQRLKPNMCIPTCQEYCNIIDSPAVVTVGPLTEFFDTSQLISFLLTL